LEDTQDSETEKKVWNIHTKMHLESFAATDCHVLQAAWDVLNRAKPFDSMSSVLNELGRMKL